MDSIHYRAIPYHTIFLTKLKAKLSKIQPIEPVGENHARNLGRVLKMS
jgi:hypothetical protein